MSIIEINELSKFYGDIKGIDDLSISINEGEIFGFLGPNGAGKTTTIRTILGFLNPSKGNVKLFGKDIRNKKNSLEIKKRIGFLPGEYSFYENVTGREMLDFFEDLKGGEERQRLIDLFSPPLDEKIKEYSHGNKQKLGLIQAFMHNPDLVILDEPTQGLDPLMQKKFNDLIIEKNKKDNLTVFFSSHILSEVRKVCDRVGLIKNGELVSLEQIDDLIKKSGKIVEADLGGELDEEDFNSKNFELLSKNPFKLVVTGDLDELIDILCNYRINDLIIRESQLEDIFMHFYEG